MRDREHAEMKHEPVPEMVSSLKQSGFKKKSSCNNITSSEMDYFKGLGFCIGRDRPKIYKKTIDMLALSTSMQFKNGIDIVVYLHSEEYLETEVAAMPEEPSDNGKQVWE